MFFSVVFPSFLIFSVILLNFLAEIALLFSVNAAASVIVNVFVSGL